MNTGIKRPVLVVAILLAAVGYAATKEWEWQADADSLPILRVARIDTGGSRDAGWRTDALTVQPEQIFQD